MVHGYGFFWGKLAGGELEACDSNYQLPGNKKQSPAGRPGFIH
jgi:hypothetical protein